MGRRAPGTIRFTPVEVAASNRLPIHGIQRRLIHRPYASNAGKVVVISRSPGRNPSGAGSGTEPVRNSASYPSATSRRFDGGSSRRRSLAISWRGDDVPTRSIFVSVAMARSFDRVPCVSP